MLKEIVRSFANLVGYEIMTLGRANTYAHCVAAILRKQQVNMVLDVGANTGQFADWIRKIGYAGRILSFEPLSEAHQALCRAAEPDSEWKVAPRMALGSVSGETVIHVARNGVSSSELHMNLTHQSAAPDSIYVDVESVILNRLDTVCSFALDDRLLLKIDVQGNEKAVLEGAAGAIKHCRAIIVEMSLVPLYDGQSMAIELWEYLISLGFQAHHFNPGFKDSQSGRLLQMDGIFARD
jgi:FkbM family methyltransferase